MMERGKGWRSPNKGKPCDFMAEVSLHRLVVEIIKQEEKSVGGIIIADQTLNKENEQKMQAKVLAIGATAWEDKSRDACDVGDIVIVGRYVGTKVQDTGDRDCRLISDLDVLGVKEYAKQTV
jgi:co-chaperonin GroES (HSP10)